MTFPDFAVLDFGLDGGGRRLVIEMEGAWLDLDGGREVGHGRLVIEGWSEMVVSRYENDAWVDVADATEESLKDICESDIGPTTTLCGFSARTGLWVRYVFYNTKAHYVLATENQ